MTTAISLTRRQLWFVWCFSALGAALMLYQLKVYDTALKSDLSPLGIVSLQLVHTGQAADELIADWRRRDVIDVAQNSLTVDFPFLVFYSVFLALSCWLLASDTAGCRFAYIALAAGALDAFENSVQLIMLAEGARDSLARLSAGFACAKFACLALVVGFLIFGVGRRLLSVSR